MELDLIYKQANQLGWKMECIKNCDNDKIKYFELKNNVGSVRIFADEMQPSGVDTSINIADIVLISVTQAFIEEHNAELED